MNKQDCEYTMTILREIESKHSRVYKSSATKAVESHRILKGILLAEEAVKMQIPEKPDKKNPICYAKSIDGEEKYAYDYYCPLCGEKLKEFEHHCTCGQALDWSE